MSGPTTNGDYRQEENIASSSRHPASPRSSSTSKPSLDLPALEPFSHDHPLLSQDTFNPDDLLQSRSHVPLEELRGELRSYLTVLREELVQLINEDYEEFISLGVGLRGEVGRLQRLEGPLDELQQEVKLVNDALRAHELLLQSNLTRRSELRDETALLESMHKLSESITRTEALLNDLERSVDVKDILRVGNEYSQIIYLLRKLETEGCAMVTAFGPQIRIRIQSKLAGVLVGAIQDRSTQGILDCLSVYDIIEGWEEVQATVQSIVRKLCDQIIQPSTLAVPATPKAPQTPHSASNPFERVAGHSALADMYNRLLEELYDLSLLFDLAEDVSPRFAFVEKVVIPCITTSIRTNLGRTIFSAGRPDELHKNYTTTSHFLASLESLAPSASVVATIRASSDLAALHRQWQLPVYFQLRWKDIVTRLERALEDPTQNKDWAIPQTAGVYEAVETCWSDEVYIQDLADRFWKLTLQILSRYRNWLHQSADVTVDPLTDDTQLRTALRAMIDLSCLDVKVQAVLATAGISQSLSDLLSSTEYSEIASSTLSARCLEQLKPIRAVASQLRTTTNRSVQPSPYISLVFRPLRTAFSDFPSLPSAPKQELTRTVAIEVFTQFNAMLLSVRKTEDLLRRHRKGRKTGFSLFGSGGQGGDADEAGEEERRFDEQMRVDIAALSKEARELGVPVEQLEEWRGLVGAMDRPLAE